MYSYMPIPKFELTNFWWLDMILTIRLPTFVFFFNSNIYLLGVHTHYMCFVFSYYKRQACFCCGLNLWPKILTITFTIWTILLYFNFLMYIHMTSITCVLNLVGLKWKPDHISWSGWKLFESYIYIYIFNYSV